MIGSPRIHIKEKLRKDWKSKDSHQREVERELDTQGCTSMMKLEKE
jgi:hypothetical protein